MPEMLACLTNAGDGGKTRFSCSTVSMFDDMRSLLLDYNSGAVVLTPLLREYNHQIEGL